MDPARARAALEAGCSKTHRGTRTTPQYPPISTPNSTACRSAFQRVSSRKVKNMAGLRSRGGRLCSLNVRNEGHNREGDARAPPRPPMLAPCVAPPLFSMVNAILSRTGEAAPMQWDGVTLKAFAGAPSIAATPATTPIIGGTGRTPASSTTPLVITATATQGLKCTT